MNLLRKLLILFDGKERKKFSIIFILMAVGAAIETAGIGLIVQFVGVATNPDIIQEKPILSNIYNNFGFLSIRSFIIVSTIVLFAIFIFKNLYLIGFYYIQYRIIYNEQVRMSKRLFEAYMRKPYTFHLNRNSAQLLRNTNVEVQRVFRDLIKSIFLLLTESLIILFIFVMLMILAPIETSLLGIVLGGGMWFFFKYFRKRISKSAQTQQRSQGEMIKRVNQGLGASKEVKVLGREKFFVNEYNIASRRFANARRFYELTLQVPRMFIETVVIGAILTIILVIMLQGSDISSLLATTSLFVMAAMRLMPSITRLMNAQTAIKNSLPALEVIFNDLIVEKVDNNLPAKDIENSEKVNNFGEKVFRKSITIVKSF